MEPSVGGITSANLTFNYLDTDVPGGATESNFAFLRRNGGMTSNEGVTTLNTTTNVFTLDNVMNFSDWSLGSLAPTAANVLIGGRVLTEAGQGIPRARLRLTDSNGNIRSTQANPFGFYRFENVEAGETYIIEVAHKSYQFANPTQVINVSDSITNLNFVAENQIATEGIFEIGGKVSDAKGRPIPNITVEITGGSLKESVTIMTDNEGRYLFDAAKAGETYILGILDEKYAFAPKVITVNEDIYDIDFLQ